MPPRIGPERPRLEPSGRRQHAQPRFRERLGQRRLHAIEVGRVDQKAHAPAVLGQEPAERVGAPDDPLAGRLPLAFTLPARQHWPRARLAARVDGDVEQARGPEHRPHAGDRRQPLLGQPQRLPVGGVVEIVDLDLDLGEADQAEARPALPAAAPRPARAAGAQANASSAARAGLPRPESPSNHGEAAIAATPRRAPVFTPA